MGKDLSRAKTTAQGDLCCPLLQRVVLGLPYFAMPGPKLAGAEAMQRVTLAAGFAFALHIFCTVGRQEKSMLGARRGWGSARGSWLVCPPLPLLPHVAKAPPAIETNGILVAALSHLQREAQEARAHAIAAHLCL